MPPKRRPLSLSKPKAKAKASPGAGQAGSAVKKATGLSAELVSLIEKLFILADENQSGTIQFSEFLVHHKSLLSLGADAMEPERASALHRMESDRETEINFHNYDYNHDLCLDRREFSSYMESLYGILGNRLFSEVCEKCILAGAEVHKSPKDGFDRVQSEMLNEKALNCMYNLEDFREGMIKLLALKADPCFTDRNGCDVLIHIADRADEATVQLLLDSRANPSAHNKEMECAAFKAAHSRNMDVLKMMLFPERFGKRSHLAQMRCNLSIIEPEEDNPAATVPRHKSMAVPSPFSHEQTSTMPRHKSMCATLSEQDAHEASEMATALASRLPGSKEHGRCSGSKAPTEMQKYEASQELVRGMNMHTGPDVKDLLARRADANYKDQNGWTPLTAAAFWGKKDSLVVLLGTQRALSNVKLRINGRNARGRAPLHVAARKGKADLIPLLISAHAEIDIKDTDGWTPLHHAAFNGQDAVVEALITAGATPDIRGRNGFTPLIASSLSSRAGNLGEEAMKHVGVPATVAFGKAIAPILNDKDMTAYDKMQAMMELPGVSSNLSKLRLHEQFFPSVAGPSKVRLQKFWESLIAPLFRRFRSGETDLQPAGPHMSEEAQKDREREIQLRWKEQKQFVQQWLRDTAGPRPNADWQHDNRAVYAAELKQVLDEELASFQKELDVLYVHTKDQPEGNNLCNMPAEEILVNGYCSQLHAHPIPAWLEIPDVAGAFEALRLVKAGNMGKDDDDAVMSFTEFITLTHGLDTGRAFWKNVYRTWLAQYAEVVDAEFQKSIHAVVDKFNLQYKESNMSGKCTAAKPKTADRIRAKEQKYGEASCDTYEGRTIAAKVLDVVRSSIIVKSPEAALILVNEFFRPATVQNNKFELVRIINRFNENAETLLGYRYLELNVHWQGGCRASACGRPSHTLEHAIIGEVQIILEDYLAVRKRRHIIYKCSNGVYDWPPDEQKADEEGTTCATRQRSSTHNLDDDDDHPMSTQISQ